MLEDEADRRAAKGGQGIALESSQVMVAHAQGSTLRALEPADE